MQIVGGTYGVSGKLSIQDGHILIHSAVEKRYPSDQIAQFTTSSRQESSFSLVTLIVTCLLLGSIGALFFNLLGMLLGILASIALSFGKRTILSAQLTFTDGGQVSVEGWHYKIQQLTNLVHQTH